MNVKGDDPSHEELQGEAVRPGRDPSRPPPIRRRTLSSQAGVRTALILRAQQIQTEFLYVSLVTSYFLSSDVSRRKQLKTQFEKCRNVNKEL